MSHPVRCEVCVESLYGALCVEANGGDRIELCANLVLGGTTPSAGLISRVVASVAIPCMVMIRPRAGDFCYEPDEVDVMLRDIDFVKQSEAHGVVLGALRPDATIDQELTGRFVEAARPMRVTFHRAFDWTPDPRVALEQIIRAGCDRVLTSGQAASVELGIALVADLVSQADGRIVVMPGCGVNEHNVSRILRDTGAAEVHFSARRKSVTATTEFEGRVPLSSVDMDARCETCPRLVRAICSAARGGNG